MGHGDRSFAAALHESINQVFDMVETTCFGFEATEGSILKTGLKASKTPQEIAEEYQPWKKIIEDVDMKLSTENSVVKVLDDDKGDNPNAQLAGSSTDAPTISGGTAKLQPKVAEAEGGDLKQVEEGYADRMISRVRARGHQTLNPKPV